MNLPKKPKSKIISIEHPKTIECYCKNKSDVEPDTANNLEHACEVWKKKDPKRHKITEKEVNLDAKTPEKDKDQLIQSLQDPKNKPQIINSAKLKKRC
ncbi:16489_t:CDS:2, partial [Gigaspora margarita]